MDTSTIQLNQLLRNQFVFNNNSPIWSCGVDVQQVKNKNALTLGSEWRTEDKITSFARWSFSKDWSIQPQYVQINKMVQSDFLNGRNYQIDENQYKIELLNRSKSQQWFITPSYVIKQWDAKRVQDQLNVSMAQVYLAKHRVGAVLKKELAKLEDEIE
jgi:hypothetical protein